MGAICISEQAGSTPAIAPSFFCEYPIDSRLVCPPYVYFFQNSREIQLFVQNFHANYIWIHLKRSHSNTNVSFASNEVQIPWQNQASIWKASVLSKISHTWVFHHFKLGDYNFRSCSTLLLRECLSTLSGPVNMCPRSYRNSLGPLLFVNALVY